MYKSVWSRCTVFYKTVKYEIPQESLNNPWSSGIQLGQGQMIRPRSRHSDRPGLFRPNMGYNSGVSLLQWGKFLNCRCNLLLLPTSWFISIYLLNTLDSNVSFPLSNLTVMQGHDDPKKFRGEQNTVPGAIYRASYEEMYQDMLQVCYAFIFVLQVI